MSEPTRDEIRLRFARAYFDEQKKLFEYLFDHLRLDAETKEQAKLLLQKVTADSLDANVRKLLLLTRTLRISKDWITNKSIDAQKKYETLIERINKEPSICQEIGGILLTILGIGLAIISAPVSISLCILSSLYSACGLTMFSCNAYLRYKQYERKNEESNKTLARI